MASIPSINSTNGSIDELATRAALVAADPVSPAVAADAALRQFLTPPREARPSAEQAMLEMADTWTILSAGSTVHVWSWGAGPIVLLVHGWGGRGTQLAPLMQPLLEAGRQVVTFDMPAHGDSSGSRTTVNAMAQTIAAVAASVGRPIEGVIAHSLGAAATTTALARGLVVKKVAYVAPVFSLAESVERFVAFLGLSAAARTHFIEAVVSANQATFEELDGPALAPTLTTPLVIVHDREDREVPYGDASRLARAWPGAQLVTTTGLGHRRILADLDVVDTVTAFVTGATTPRLLLDEWARIELDLADREGRRARAFP